MRSDESSLVPPQGSIRIGIKTGLCYEGIQSAEAMRLRTRELHQEKTVFESLWPGARTSSKLD
jgi:hypothetical protein